MFNWRENRDGGIFATAGPFVLVLESFPTDWGSTLHWSASIRDLRFARGSAILLGGGLASTPQEGKQSAEAAVQDWLKKAAEACGWELKEFV